MYLLPWRDRLPPVPAVSNGGQPAMWSLSAAADAVTATNCNLSAYNRYLTTRPSLAVNHLGGTDRELTCANGRRP